MLSWLTIIRELRDLSKSSDAPAVLGLKEGVIKELRERLDAYNVKDSAYEEKITAIEEAMDRCPPVNISNGEKATWHGLSNALKKHGL